MLYTEDTRIEALAVHVVGNKSKDEPLTVSPELSAQVADEGLMRTLTAYFLGGFKSEDAPRHMEEVVMKEFPLGEFKRDGEKV